MYICGLYVFLENLVYGRGEDFFLSRNKSTQTGTHLVPDLLLPKDFSQHIIYILISQLEMKGFSMRVTKVKDIEATLSWVMLLVVNGLKYTNVMEP